MFFLYYYIITLKSNLFITLYLTLIGSYLSLFINYTSYGNKEQYSSKVIYFFNPEDFAISSISNEPIINTDYSAYYFIIGLKGVKFNIISLRLKYSYELY